MSIRKHHNPTVTVHCDYGQGCTETAEVTLQGDIAPDELEDLAHHEAGYNEMGYCAHCTRTDAAEAAADNAMRDGKALLA